MYPFEEFPKIPRLKREITVTEKIDGTNAQIAWVPITGEVHLAETQADSHALDIVAPNDGDTPMALYVGSRNRWLDFSSTGDNFGFAKWVHENRFELYKLGPGRHYGEWWGSGIQRGYGLPPGDRRFSLFNVLRWGTHNPNTPACVSVVPLLARGEDVDPMAVLRSLQVNGSHAAPFMNPEGIVVFHSASRQLYKLTLEKDGGKWQQ
jgi:hypothetical protein